MKRPPALWPTGADIQCARAAQRGLQDTGRLAATLQPELQDKAPGRVPAAGYGGHRI